MNQKPLASFHILSDIHINNDPARSELYAAGLRDMATVMPETNFGYISAGDMTGHGAAEETEAFYRLTRDFCPVRPQNTLLLLGNHDARGPQLPLWNKNPALPCPDWDEIRTRYTTFNAPYFSDSSDTETLYHKKVLGGFTFLMLNTQLGLKDAPYIGPDQLEWLERCMQECWQQDPEKPVFLVSHQALNNTHWRSNVLDAFDGLSNEAGTGPAGTPQEYCWGADQAVKTILKKYPNGVLLSGHIHNQPGVAELQIREWGVAVDLPSFGEPELGCPKSGVGYEMVIYPDQILFRARNFAAGHWLPEYDLSLPLPALPVVLKQADEQDVPETRNLRKKARSKMARIYNQEGMAWNCLDLPAEFLFDASTRAELEEIRQTLLKSL